MGSSVREVLAESVFGQTTPLEWDEVSRYLSSQITSEREKARRRHYRQRQEFYCDQGHHHMRELIELAIKDPRVRALRKEWVEAAGFNPLTRRIINTLSTAYQEPAARKVDGKQNNDLYQRAQREFRVHDRARHWNRLANLHRTILVQVRIRNIGSESSPVLEPRLDIITPDQIALLITSPKDPTRLEGAVIQLGHEQVRESSTVPEYVLWTNRERGYLNERGQLIGVPTEHGFERMPLVLLRLDDDTQSLWSRIGASLIAAHKADWFEQVCLMKESKSATKVAVLSGDLTTAAFEQSLDSEAPILLPDGVSHQLADMSMDLTMFRDTGTYVTDTIASSNGIAPTVLRHQGVQSAEARDLMRVPLRELRLEQHGPLRYFERELAAVMAMVCASDMPELAFDMKGWHVDFADPQTPRSPKQQYEEFEHANRLRLTSHVTHVKSQNPDLSEDQARELIIKNITDELWFQVLQRPFMVLTGQMQGVPSQATPADTGKNESDDDSDGRNAVTPTPKGEEENNGRAA